MEEVSLTSILKKRLVPFYNGLGSRDWRFSNKIHSAFSDKQGNLWLCTHSKGLEKVTYRNVPFAMMTPMPHEHESLHNEVRAPYAKTNWVICGLA